MFKSVFLTSMALLIGMVSLNGCQTFKDVFLKPGPSFVSLDEANTQLANAKVCCENNLFNGHIINVTKASSESYDIDESNAEAFNFETGKSFFKIFQLPLNISYLSISFESAIITTTFQPRVDFYNSNHQLVSSIRPSAFKYRDSAVFDGVLAAKIVVNNASAKPGRELAYMVVYTTPEELKGSTFIMHPEVKRNIAMRNTVDKLPDIKIPHAPIGTLNITFKFKQDDMTTTESLLNYLDGPLIGGKEEDSNRQENVVLSSGEVYSVSSQREGTSAVISTDSKGNNLVNSNDIAGTGLDNKALNNTGSVSEKETKAPMMKETEELYNSMIRKAIEAGDYEKAFALVAEAERAGSTTAQKTFIEASKSKR